MYIIEAGGARDELKFEAAIPREAIERALWLMDQGMATVIVLSPDGRRYNFFDFDQLLSSKAV